MPKKETMWVFAVLLQLSLIAGHLAPLAQADALRCGGKNILKTMVPEKGVKPWPVLIDYQGPKRCYANSFETLVAFQAQGHSLENAEVLYLSHFNQWETHAVVAKDGFIYDSDLTDRNGLIRPQPLLQYFYKRHFSPESKMSVISAKEYFEHFLDRGSIYYSQSIRQRGQIAVDVKFPTYFVQEFYWDLY